MKRPLKRRLKHGMVLLAAASLALAGSGCATKPVDQPTQEEKQTPVKVSNITNRSLTVNKEIVGTMKADVTVTIMPKMSGELISLNIKKGDQVQKGQVLGKIDDRDLRTTVELQQAALEAQQAALSVAIANEKSVKTTIDGGASASISAAMNEASISWTDAKKNLERVEALYNEGVVSKIEYESAVTAEHNAKLNYEKSKIDIEKAEIGVKSSQAQLRQTELNVKQAQDRLKDTLIEATQSGEVVEVNAEVGDTVGLQTPLFKIVGLNPILIESTISAGQLALFKEGQKVNVVIPVLHKEVSGVVSYISPIANASGLYVVEAKIENKDKAIKPGMIGEFVLGQTIVEKALIIPTEAIVEQGGSTKIFIIKDGRAVEKVIEIIESQTDFTAIIGDVSDGDQVVIKGQNTLMDGNLVNVIEEGK
ncbi:MAG TPA: efflux RND transporter periplasmic adaptor subunit [Bacillales bacterium]|nr:efflux RND transporter periplasmic adaptor subunit [Bacillales bacterium]